MTTTLVTTELPFPLYARGKVRDIYELPDDRLLLVATDRLSAFDHVLPTAIPDRGRVLTRLSAFWFTQTTRIIPNHFLFLGGEPARRNDFTSVEALDEVGDRGMIVRRARRIDVECVVRGYLAGSAWEEYRRAGTVAGMRLPDGLKMADRLPEPIFTPATKAATGHDENITFVQMQDLVGAALAERLHSVSVALYKFASAHAEARALVLADTKFEFGLARDGSLLLIDEALTPDSSRYWDADAYAAGEYLPFDKQYVRDYLIRINWNREPPAPALPTDIVAATAERYREVYRRLIGSPLDEVQT